MEIPGSYPVADPLDRFYLVSTEDPGTIDEPRTCRVVRRVTVGEDQDCLLVEIDPPLIGQQFGLGGQDVDILILGARHVEGSLFPVWEWPTYVNVSRPTVDNPKLRADFTVEEADFFDIGAIYRTEESARRGD